MLRLQDIALSPVYLAQALGFLVRVPRLPEAAGPRAGRIGQGPELRLLILGDSSGAGVGVAEQDHALTGQMLKHLSATHDVHWRLIARSGATTAGALAMLRAVDGRFDTAVLALGVNDVLRQTPRARFAARQSELMDRLQSTHGVTQILASAVPPLGAFEVVPMPLRAYFGHRARVLDAELQDVCKRMGAVHVPLDLDPAPHWLASDGLHPGAALYAEWGRRMAGLASRGVS